MERKQYSIYVYQRFAIKPDDFRRVFIMLRNRDFARCGASCRLRREPGLVKLSENKEGGSGERFSFDEKWGATGGKKT